GSGEGSEQVQFLYDGMSEAAFCGEYTFDGHWLFLLFPKSFTRGGEVSDPVIVSPCGIEFSAELCDGGEFWQLVVKFAGLSLNFSGSGQHAHAAPQGVDIYSNGAGADFGLYN